jgi:hypothetical protein
MADPVNVTTTVPGSVTSFVVDLGENRENDLILIGIAWRASGTITISGYDSCATQQTTDAYYSEWFVKKAGAGGESSPTASKTGSAGFARSIAYVLRGADVSGTALNAIDAIGSTAGATGATLTSHALTTIANDCLVIHGAIWDSTSVIADPADLNALANVDAFVSGMTFKATAGAIPTFTFTGNNASNAGRAWAISIKNASGGEQPIRLTDGRVYLQKIGGFSSPTVGIPDSVSGLTAIDGLNMNTVANTTAGTFTVSTGMPVTLPWQFNGTSFTCTQTITAEAWVGAFLSQTSTDVDGKTSIIPFGFGTTVDNTRVGSKGNIYVLVDSFNNWVAYQLLPQTKWTAAGDSYVAIKYGTTETLDASAGAIDFTDVVNVGYFHHRKAATSTSIVVYHLSTILESATSVLIGGSADYPITVERESFFLSGGNTYPNEQSFQGSGQLVNYMNLQLGDGTAETHVKHTAQSYDIPASSDTKWQVGAGGAGLVIKASANDVHDLRSAVITSSILQPFTIDAASSLSASLLTTGLSVIGRTFSDLAGYDWTSASWTDCATVSFKNGDVTTCTIASPNDSIHGTTGAACSFSAGGATVSGSSISCVKSDGSSVTGYHLELGTAVTAITLTDVTFTGTPGTDKVHVLATTGTVTITISGTTSLVAGDVTSAGATVVISGPTINQKVTISGITTGARVQIYDTTSSTELFNGTASAGDTVVSGSTVVWTDPAAATADRAIRVRVSYVSGATAKNFIETSGLTCGQTAGTAEITYPVSPTDDTVYNANAITGSGVTGVTFTDAATDVVNINVVANAISWKTIYAAWVYYVFGATGIASDIDYIDAVDEANYILSNMIIKNTSSPTAPLEVTGGYGRDSVTGATIDLADTTGGTLIFAPDHVVSYAVGSGVTAQDITDIAAEVLTAAASTPIHSDVRKVVGITVDGTGTEGDPWGPD